MNCLNLNPEARGARFCVLLKSNYCIQEGEDGQEQRGRIRPFLQSQIIKSYPVLLGDPCNISPLPVLSVTKQETKVRGKMVRRQKAKEVGRTINHLLG